MEDTDQSIYEGRERRAESRSLAERYSSVECSIKDLPYNYQFKIWDTSPSGLSILIKEDSAVLEHLKVGDTLEMKYYPVNMSRPPDSFKTKIKHITKDEMSRFKGLYQVGLSVSEKKE